MMPSAAIGGSGVLLSLAAGVLNGSFAAPTKYTTRWKWENIWAVWAVVAFLVVPWTVALITVPDLFGVYAAADAGTIGMLITFGAGYGVAAACFGLGVDAIGIALNFAIALGLSTAVGSLIPLLTQHNEQAFTRKGLTVFAGIALMLIGISVSAAAGRSKEPGLASSSSGKTAKPSFAVGLTFAIIAGIGSPLLNFGIAYGGPLLRIAAAHGASASAQSNAIWPLVLTATLVPYLAYCTFLWRKNRSFHLFGERGTAPYWLLGGVMGVLWMGSIALYGAASNTMADMGPVLGWPLFMSAIILTSNVWGLATGEWKGASRSTLTMLGAGMFLLMLGFGALAYSARLT